MMDSNEINQALERVKATSGKNDKIAMLKELLEDANFRWAIVQAMDPRVRFGIAQKTLDDIERRITPSVGADFTFWDHRSPIDVVIMLETMAAGQMTGNAAKERIEMLCRTLHADSWDLLKRILLKKPDAGIDSSVNKARPNTIWTFDCMLAHPFEAKRVKEWPVAVEPKIDGVRCLITVTTDGTVGFFSRSGKEFNTFGHLVEPVLAAWKRSGFEGGIVIDCEIDSGAFLETVSQARKKEGEATDAVARIFDLMTDDEWVKGCDRPYTQRRQLILEVFGPVVEPFHPRLQPLPVELARDGEQVMEIAVRFQANGLEGVIVKPLDHRYERKRSYSWMKVKGFETHDVVITGFFEGNGKYKGAMGGVICDFGGVEVRVGGGWSDDDRQVMWDDQDAYVGRMIEVGAHETTPDGSLRHPRFIRWRDDKQEAA